jgi:hypothetical protein
MGKRYRGLPQCSEEVFANIFPVAEKSNKNALLWTFLWHYKWRVLEGVLPRLAYTGFLFAQPFLLQRVLDFVSNRDVEKDETGYGLIGAYAVVYIGIAVCNLPRQLYIQEADLTL